MSKPFTILLVPGAFHTEEHLVTLSKALEERGHPVSCARLASLGSGSAALADDVKHIRTAVEHITQIEGKDVVVMLHSFAGRPGGYALAELKDDKHIRGVIYLAALDLSEEMAQKLVGGGSNWRPWQRLDESTGLLYAEGDAKNLFYQDVSEPLAAELAAKLQPHSAKALRGLLPGGERVATSSTFDGKRAYIACKNDLIFPYEAQRAIITARTENRWIEREIESGHSPFASMPDQLAEHIISLGKGFAKV